MHSHFNSQGRTGQNRRDSLTSRIPISRSTPAANRVSSISIYNNASPEFMATSRGPSPQLDDEFDGCATRRYSTKENDRIRPMDSHKQRYSSYCALSSDPRESSNAERRRKEESAPNTRTFNNPLFNSYCVATSISRPPPAACTARTSTVPDLGYISQLPRSRTQGTIGKMSPYVSPNHAVKARERVTGQRYKESSLREQTLYALEQKAPRYSGNEELIYEAHSITWWTGRFSGLRDRSMDGLLLADNMETIITAHSSAVPKILQSKPVRSVTTTSSRRATSRSLPPAHAFDSDRASLTEAVPSIISRGTDSRDMQDLYSKNTLVADQQKADCLLDDDKRTWRVLAHLDSLCATEEARNSLIDFQREIGEARTKPSRTERSRKTGRQSDDAKQNGKRILSSDFGLASKFFNGGTKNSLKNNMLRKVMTGGPGPAKDRDEPARMS